MQSISAIYQYRDLTGAVVHETLRYAPEKDFRQRRPGPDGQYIWSLSGIEPVLYRLPEITKAIAQGTPVFLCEGEKDADNLVKLGLEATTAAMGCGKWRKSYTETLKGALCFICPDNDTAGWAHALNVLEEIYYDAECVKIIRLPGPGKDASDWIEAGGTAAQLMEIADNEPVTWPLAARRFYWAQLQVMTPAELLAEIEHLKTAPLRDTPKAQLVEYQLRIIRKSLKHQIKKKGGIDLAYATT